MATATRDRGTGRREVPGATPGSGRDPTLGLLPGLAGVAVFSLTLPVTRIAVPATDPAFLASGRTAMAGLVGGLTLLASALLPGERLDPLTLLFFAATVVLVRAARRSPVRASPARP